MWCLEASIIQVLGNAQLASLCRGTVKVSALHCGQIAPAVGGFAGMKCVTNPLLMS